MCLLAIGHEIAHETFIAHIVIGQDYSTDLLEGITQTQFFHHVFFAQEVSV